jgi:hypothetical protein
VEELDLLHHSKAAPDFDLQPFSDRLEQRQRVLGMAVQLIADKLGIRMKTNRLNCSATLDPGIEKSRIAFFLCTLTCRQVYHYMLSPHWVRDSEMQDSQLVDK